MTGPPTTLDGRYRLIAPLATGGMSVVWRGHDTVLSREVAIKVLSGRGTAGDAHRVHREAMSIARINHPYIANVYDYGECPGPDGTTVSYIVMELVEGESLAQVLARGPLSWPTAAGICAQVASALSAAHRGGVVHRDVTPANVMLAVDGVKVIDFGISAAPGQASEGQQYGTPAYLAPERLTGGPAQAATDVYGLGLLLYQSIAGHLPWTAASTTQMLSAHVYVPPAPLPATTGLPPRLGALCAQMLAVDPARRPTALAVSAELSALARAGDPRARPALQSVPIVPAVPMGTRPDRPRTRVLPHGAASMPDPDAATIARGGGAAGPRHNRHRGLFVLPATLMLILVTALGFAELHPSGAGAGPAPSAAPSAPGAAAPQPVIAKPESKACTARYEYTSQWIFGFSAQIVVVNSGSAALAGWSVRFDLPDGQRLAGGWNGQWKQKGSAVTVRDLAYNRSLPAGASVTLGFIATSDPGAGGTPDRFTLNGVTCGS